MSLLDLHTIQQGKCTSLNAIWAFWSWFSGFSVASMTQAVANKARVTNEEKRKVAVKKKDNLIDVGDKQRETDEGVSMTQGVAYKSKEKGKVAVKKKDNLFD